MKVYCHPRCSTCKKTIKVLNELELDFEYIDLTITSVDYDTLLKIYNESDLELKKYFNTSGVVYREENIKELFGKVSDEDLIKMLSKNGLLLKRPFIIADKVYVGNKVDEIMNDFKK